MVVEVIDVGYVTVFEPKGHSPIPGYRGGIMALEFTFQWMEPQSREINVLGALAPIEHAQNIP